MRTVLRLRGVSFEVYLREEAGDLQGALRFDSHGEALAWLRMVAQEPWNRAPLRRLVSRGALGMSLAAREDHELWDEIAGRLVAGWIRVVEGERVGLPGFDGEVVEAEPGGFEETKRYQEKTWITIQLVGEDDMPIPGEKYRITLPDGTVREGRLDGEGLARFSDIDPGMCEVTFPELDEEAWVPIGMSGER